MDFWERLNALIKLNKVTQEWIANNTGIKYATLRNWSARKIIPDALQAVKIAKALNTTVEYLVTGEDMSESARKLETIKLKLQELQECL